MYGVEQKIINWLKKLKTQPVSNSVAKKTTKTAVNNYSTEDSDKNVNDDGENKTNVSNTNKSKSEMLETLKKYRNKLDGIVDDEYLKKMEYTEKSANEIKDEATKFAEDKFDLSKVKLDGNIENKRKEYSQNEEDIKATTNELKGELDKKYENLLDNAQNKAIKNGIARSSILAETVKNLSQDKIQEYLNVDSEIAEKLKDNANKLSAYENEYASAVSALEIQKAIDIKDKIEKLNKEQEKKIEEVLKYNNAIDEKIYKLQTQGAQLPSEKESAEYKKQMLNSVLEYYYSLDPELALEEFNNDVDVQYVLGGLSKVVENYLKNR